MRSLLPLSLLLAACIPPSSMGGGFQASGLTFDSHWVKVAEIAPTSVSASVAPSWVGRTCALAEPPNPGGAPGWYAHAHLVCTDTMEYHLYDLRLEVAVAPQEYWPGVGGHVRITGLGESDPQYGFRQMLVGRVCSLEGPLAPSRQPGFYAAVVACNDGRRYALDAASILPTTEDVQAPQPAYAGPAPAVDEAAPVAVAPVQSGTYCYDYTFNDQRTGKKCFGDRQSYCISECSESNPLAQQACARECQ